MRHEFLPLADVAFIYDNSGNPPLLIAEKRSNLPFVVRDEARWKLIEDVT
jgi:predicted ABC-type ATPase